MPHQVAVQIKGIEAKEETVEQAVAGNICDFGINIPADFDISFLQRGNVLCEPKWEIPLVNKFLARVIIYELGDCGAIVKGEQVMVHFQTLKVEGQISRFVQTVDPKKNQETIKKAPKVLKSGDYGDIVIKLKERQCIELYKNFGRMGRVVIRKGDFTIGAGTVSELLG